MPRNYRDFKTTNTAYTFLPIFSHTFPCVMNGEWGKWLVKEILGVEYEVWKHVKIDYEHPEHLSNV